jgi:hypothetical protein
MIIIIGLSIMPNLEFMYMPLELVIKYILCYKIIV